MLKKYAYHRPSEVSLVKITELREAYSTLEKLVDGVVHGSREKAIALTHLETSAMFAFKAVVVNDPESVTEVGALASEQ